nr:unnamed protein product [Spirometra erinaceieuropaei]
MLTEYLAYDNIHLPSSSLTVLSQACDGGDEDSVQSSLHAVSHPDQGSPSPRPRRQLWHQPQTPSSDSSNYRPSIIPPPASLASSSATCQQPASRISAEHSLPVPTPRHTDSFVRMTFGPPFDMKKLVVQEEVNMHNVRSELAIPDEEMSTEVDIALLTSLDSEAVSTLSSSDWVSEHSVSTPAEMRVHAPLPVWRSDKLMESSEVGRLPLVRKRRAFLTVQAAGDMCEAVTLENCLIYAAHRAWPRRLVKRKSNVKWPAISVTRSFETAVSILCMGGDDVVEEVSVSSQRNNPLSFENLQRICSVSPSLNFFESGYGESICEWSKRVIPSGANGNFTITVPVYYSYRSGYINEEPFGTYPWARGWCTYKQDYFRCPYGDYNDLYTTVLTLPNIQNVSYVMLKDSRPITLHKEEDTTVPGFYVRKGHRLEVCPQYLTVNLVWYFNGNESNLQDVSCYMNGEQFCSGLQPGEKQPDEKCAYWKTNDRIRIGYRFYKPSTRFGYYYCYLDKGLTKALTYIVDWKNATKTRDTSVVTEASAPKDLPRALPITTSSAEIILREIPLLWLCLGLSMYL